MKDNRLSHHSTAHPRRNLTKRLGCSLVFFLVIVLAGPLVAQPSGSATNALHSLWKAEGKRSTVYLLGSVHVLKAENYPLPAVIETAFSNSVIAAFETDVAAMERLDAQQKLLTKAMLPEGETLAGQLSPAVYASLSNHLVAVGLPAMLFERLKPGMAAMTLALLEIQKLGFDPTQGLDLHFSDRARKEGKEIVPLETVEFQIGLITDFSKEEGELLVKVTLEETDQLQSEVAALLKAWETGDAMNLEKILNEAAQKAPAIFKRLLTDRNQRWVPRIEEWLAGDKNTIVIVGAGHLVGQEGVVELLRKKGFKVTQQ
jgi:uncharacterized protein YbaP (TraB family)